jgi:hypothetical protein
MKETHFLFELGVVSHDSAETLAGLKEKLLSLDGVDSVNMAESRRQIDLSLNVRFDDSDEAKKLHRKVMKIIKGDKRVTILSTTTTLSDIF